MLFFKNKKLVRFFAFVFVLGMVATDAKAQTQIFTNPSDNYYRIPSLIRMLDNSLWAFADLRYGGNGDLGNHRIDIYGKKSTDNGKTWESNASAVVSGDANASGVNVYKYAFGDASTVVDRVSGKVLMLTPSGKTGYSATTTTPGYPYVARHVYENGTWTTSNVSESFYGADKTYANSLFPTSGKMIQSTIIKKGAYFRVYATVVSNPSIGSRVVYSDDFGATWNYLGGASARPVTDGDECKVEELPDGSILLSTRVRTGTGRHFNVFKYDDMYNGTGKWQASYVTSGTSDASDQTYSTQCNGELLLVPAKSASGVQTYVLLLSAPNDNSGLGRIYWKELPKNYTNPSSYVSGWNRYVASSSNLSFGGYSTMVLDKNGDVALLTENGRYGFGIKFTTLTLTTITGNAFTFSPSRIGTYHTTSEPFSPGAYKLPTFSLNGGTYTEDQNPSLRLSNDDKNVTIYYTLDGSDPVIPTASATTPAKANSLKKVAAVKGTQVYTQPIVLSKGTTIVKALSADANGNHSSIVSASYNVVSSSSTGSVSTNKTGTTVTMDIKSASPLFSYGAQQADIHKQPFSYLRHNNTHVQIVSATKPGLKETGTDLLGDVANNMNFVAVGTDSLLAWYNGRAWNPRYNTPFGHFGIVTPKGYRFIRFEMVLDKSNASHYAVTRYKYDDAGNVVPLDSVLTEAGKDVTFSKTLSNSTNALYFRVNLGTRTVTPVIIKSLRLTYAIDEPYVAGVPSNRGDSIHTGFVNFGTFSNNKSSLDASVRDNANGKNGYWAYNAANVTDLIPVNVRKDDDSQPAIAQVGKDYYYAALSEGDYYVEAPAKFRIVGANIKLKSSNVQIVDNAVYTPSESSNGDVVVFQSKDGSQYLKMDANGNGVPVTNRNDATEFTITHTTSGYTITTNGKYLFMTNAKAACHLTATPSYWNYINGGYRYNVQGPGLRYLIYSGKTKSWGFSYKTDDAASAHTVTASYTATPFNATVYNREGTQAATNGSVSIKADGTEQSVALTDLNNDAVRIHISDVASGSAALFNVNLTLLPLNPEIPTLQAAAKDAKGDVVGNYQVTSLNYDFNNGNTVRVPVLATDAADADYTMVFRNAYNEERTLWYTTGSNSNNLNVKGGYSNYYLVGSHADTELSMNVDDNTSVPSARIDVNEAGSKFIPSTNTKSVGSVNFQGDKQHSYETAENSQIVDNIGTKENAGYATVTMKTSSAPKTVYVYSADVPTYTVMPSSLTRNRHIDFRSFTIKVQPVQSEKPVIQLVTLYDKTFKSDIHKNPLYEGRTYNDKGTVDSNHKFVGVKVTSQAEDGQTVYGALTAKQIFTALRDALKDYSDYSYWFTENPQSIDSLRGVLYVDMSGLTSVSIDNQTKAYMEKTADNCLFFMPEGFAGSNIPNAIGKFGNSYTAIGDITVYDQQPFFSPYDFQTGTYSAIYTREGTVNGLDKDNLGSRMAKVKNMAAILPFNINLDGNGHPYTTSDKTDEDIVFHDITGSGHATFLRYSDKQPVSYAVYADVVKDDVAHANQPYYVTNSRNEGGFSFNIGGAQFAKTGDVTYATTDTKATVSFASLTRYKSWKPTGTYSGVAIPKTDADWSHLWYFSKDYFWNAYKLKDNDHFNVRPFRAYYYASIVLEAKVAAVVFDKSEIVTTGITNVKGETTHTGKVYTIDGRYVGTSLEGLAPGLYIQDGRKVVKQ